MEFLKALFGDKALTYDEVVKAINAHNGDEANKDNLIKIGNLGGGDYVGKAKYDALQEALNGKASELDAANGLIEQLKKDTKGNEDLQTKISGYETQVTDLQAQLAETKVKSALKVALLSEKATDIDYLTYKLEEKLKADGKKLELDDNENIKGIDDLMSGLKTQFPTQFETAGQGDDVDVFNLEGNNQHQSMTKKDLLNKPYAERQKIYEENPEAYNKAMNS